MSPKPWSTVIAGRGRADLKFSSGLHVNYAETVLPMRDGLPKLKDFPAPFGGSGEYIAE